MKEVRHGRNRRPHDRARVERLFGIIEDPNTGETYTSARVAQMSLGDLTEECIEGIMAEPIADPTVSVLGVVAGGFGGSPPRGRGRRAKGCALRGFRRSQGGVVATEAKADVHHRAPRCLLRLFDAAAAGLAHWSEFDAEAERWGIEARGLSREDLSALIEGSTREISAAEHRRLHQEEGDFARWGRRGGRKTLVLYVVSTSRCSPASGGAAWSFGLWTITVPRSQKGAGRDDPLPRVYLWCPRTQQK